MSSIIKPGDVYHPRQRGLYRFACCPLGLLRSRDLSSGAKLCWIVLANCDGPDGCFPGHEHLADAIGVSVESLKRYIRELRAAKLIRIETGPNRRNRYVFLWQDGLNHGVENDPYHGVKNDPIMGSNLHAHGVKSARAYKEEKNYQKRKSARAARSAARSSGKPKKSTPCVDPDTYVGMNLTPEELKKWRS
jgi:hypothetical protein